MSAKKTNPFWTAEELNALVTTYGRMPLREIHEKHIPTRSMNGIQQKALKMGLTSSWEGRLLTEDEIQLIREKREQGMTVREIQKRYLPDHGYKQLSKKAQQLGLGRRPAPRDMPRKATRPWTADELEVLKAHYGTMPISQLRDTYFPDRTVQGVTNRAYAACLSDKGHDGWSDGEIALLRQHAETLPATEIHRQYIPDKSVTRITTKARALGLSACKPKHHWTQEELAVLRQYYGEVTTDCLMRMLPGRTLMSLRHGVGRILRKEMPAPDSIQERNRKDPPRLRYAHVRGITVTMDGLSCAACRRELRPGQDALVCPRCAAVFCPDCEEQADTHFKSHID